MITVGDKQSMLTCPRTSQEPACVELERVGGDPANLVRQEDASCTMEYAPVRATATGFWDGTYHRFDRTFPNACELVSFGGPVFVP
ncbi:SSI family serine proteinase inhibitor [Nonomuraea sp. NPDC000554]|uniref:SSI family serine proteinase inhibitor n=1 Tax=Nonomuraea sp. NPDC000554 TaxID=3154259 RepID=UPI00332C04B3